MFKPNILAAVSLLVVSVPAAAQADEPALTHHLAHVAVDGERTIARLVELDFDLAACHGVSRHAEHVEVIATDAELARLERSGFDFEVVISDLEQHHARDLARFGPFIDGPTPPLGQGAMGGHWTLDQAVSILDDLAARFPGLCSAKTSLGKSHEGRDIWMVKISDNVSVDENEPEAFFDALHHAREPLSMETTILFMSELLEGYGTDAEATYIVDNRELYFVPVVNPDGYEYNRRTNPNGGGYWRKNRRNNGGSRGVDLNRNYATGFGGPGSSGSGSSDTYRGPSAFSEPETAAIENFCRGRNFPMVFSVHTYTDILLRPWGTTATHPANRAEYDRLGKVLTQQNGISHGAASIVLYVASGVSLDHHHAAHGSLAWTPELGRSSEGGFWPNSANTVKIAARHQPMFRQAAVMAGQTISDGQVILMSNGNIGSSVKLAMFGSPGANALLLAASGPGNMRVPGVEGPLLLDPGSLLSLPPLTFGSAGYLSLSGVIPNVPALRGQTVHAQMLHVKGNFFSLGNAVQVTYR